MKRGDVRWYRFPKPNKRRPVVILTRPSALAYLREVTIAPLTSTVRGIPSEVALDQDDGVPRLCAVNLDHIQTVAKERIEEVITTLSAAKMEKIGIALAFALDL